MMPIYYHSGFFTFEAAVEWCKKWTADGGYKNPRIFKNLTGPLTGRFTAMVDETKGHPLCTCWVDHSKGPNELGDESVFTLERKVD